MAFAPLVSIVVPCYNYGRFISDALDSVLHQTYTNWECLIVDDGSTDNTQEVSQQYSGMDARFKYIYQENKGLAGARNTALQQAKGSYIQLLDADDMLEERKLFLQVALFEENEHIDLIFSNMLLFKNGDAERNFKPFQLAIKPVAGKGDILIENLMIDNFFLPGCVIFRRSLYEKVGLFRKGMSGLEDWNYWFRAALLGAEFYNDRREGTHLLARSHGSNMSSNEKKMLYSRIKAREDIMNFTNELQRSNKLILKAAFKKRISNLHHILLARDKAKYNLYYADIFPGITAVFQHAYFSRKPYFAFYEGAHWIKERLKNGSKA